MFSLGKSAPSSVCALIIDVGSGSVGMSLIHAEEGKKKPKVIWSHREFALMRDTSDFENDLRLITTTLVNAFLEFGSSGLKDLKAYDNSLKVEKIQVSLAAPWSYTVTKKVNYSDEHPFTVDKDLVKELAESAHKESLKAMEEAGLIRKNLTLVDNDVIGISINGYVVHELSGHSGRTLELFHVVAVAQNILIKTIKDSRDKIIPKAKLETHSFMYLFYQALTKMHPDTSEVCLIDVTKEATEVGIVREGVLQHTTHIPYGSFTMAREIAKTCNIPKEEAYTLFKGSDAFVTAKLSPSAQEQVTAIISAYELKVASLFKKTGDTLSIPTALFLHCDGHTEEFFNEHIKKGAQEATKSEHTVHPITSKLFDEDSTGDTGILLSCEYFQQNFVDRD